MPASPLELKGLQDTPSYARFIRTNLHVHTPATPWDWNAFEGQTIRASELNPESFFEALTQTSLELIAITDHNCITWCEPLIRLAKKYRKEGKGNIHILPGVEITTHEGPHLVAIFDENQSLEEVTQFLHQIGLTGKGEQADHTSVLMTDVMTKVSKLHGLVVAPHVDNEKNGLWGYKGFKGREDALNHPDLGVLACPSGSIKIVKERNNRRRLLVQNMDNTRILNYFGFLNVSDCHRIEDLELNSPQVIL